MFRKRMLVAMVFALSRFACAEEAVSSLLPVDLAADGLASTSYDMKLKPLMLSQGCVECCQSGQCQTGYRDQLPGVCCAAATTSCCPTFYNGRRYYCAPNGCSATPTGYNPPSPVYYNPPSPAYRPPSPMPPPPMSQNTYCNVDTGGTCKVLGCSSSRGPTDCVGGFFSGKCLCQKGYCAYNGKCTPSKSCDNWTPGTCRLLGCSSKRGDAECVHGKCVCKKGACAVDGVCVDSCQKDTGGTCHIMGCKGWRDAVCKSGHCMCRRHHCSFNGACEKGGRVSDVSEMYLLATNATARIMKAQKSHEDLNSFSSLAASYIDMLPDADDPVAMTISVMMLFVALATSLVVRSFRHRIGASFRAPLLEGA